MRLVLVLFVMILAVIFAVQNAAPVSVTVFFWQLEASLAVIVAICFAMGAIIAGMMALPAVFRRRTERRLLLAKIDAMEATHFKRPEPSNTAPVPAVHAPPPIVSGV